MFRAPRLQKLVSCHVRGGERRKCDLFECVCVCVWRQRDTVLTLSESQTANYKNPTATSPSVSPSASLYLTSFALPVSLSTSLRLTCLTHSVFIYLSISPPSYTNLDFINKTPIEGGLNGGRGEREGAGKGRSREMKAEGRGEELRGD